ncbi:MAG: hypothetical protein V7746_15450 [Halioglobus sp.]
MSETIFVDRRSSSDRRSDGVSSGLMRCRRRSQDRRRDKAARNLCDNWWLHVQYAAGDSGGSK